MNNIIKQQVIGIDIGFDTTTIALVDLRGMILAKESLKTSHFPDISSMVETFSQCILNLSDNFGGYDKIRSIGVAAASANYKTGCIENAVNMSWEGVIPLAALLRDRTGLAVALGNNAHAAAMGEYVYGLAHGMKNFVVISLGHGGVGSCFFSNGHPHLGYRGSAGELGHCCVVPDGRLCKCGRKGCLEAYINYAGVIQTAREMLEASDEPSLLRSQEELTMGTIADCCQQGDHMAQEVYNFTGELLGRFMANYATVVNPEAIILTGVNPKLYKCLEPSVEQAFNEHVFHNIRNKVKLLVSILDDCERDVLGASALAWTVKEYSLFL